MKLTKSWFPDLIKLIILKFVTIFINTNDFEDKPGEQAIIKIIGGNIVYENKDNPFKSMTTYTSEENDKIWACASSTTALPLPSLMKTSFLFIFSKNFLLKILTVSFVSGKVA